MENQNLNFSESFKPDGWSDEEAKEALKLFEGMSHAQLVKLVNDNKIDFGNVNVESISSGDLINVLFADVEPSRLLEQLKRR